MEPVAERPDAGEAEIVRWSYEKVAGRHIVGLPEGPDEPARSQIVGNKMRSSQRNSLPCGGCLKNQSRLFEPNPG